MSRATRLGACKSGTAPTDRDVRAEAEGGQATVEFALVLPIFIVLALSLVQVALVVSAQLQLEQAARAAARAAAVDPRLAVAEAAATEGGHLDGLDAQVSMSLEDRDPQIVEVVITGKMHHHIPLVSVASRHLKLSASAVMAVESPTDR